MTDEQQKLVTEQPPAAAGAGAEAPAAAEVEAEPWNGEAKDASFEKNYLEWSISSVKATNTFMYGSIATLGVFSVLYLVFIGYLGTYGYSNPDAKNAFYIEGLDSVAVSQQDARDQAALLNVAVRAGYPIDMGHLFRTWFLWGFWGSVFQVCILATLIPLCLFVKQIKLFNVIALTLQGVVFVNNVAWFLLGFFWRFSRAGRVASGEKLERDGNITDEAW